MKTIITDQDQMKTISRTGSQGKNIPSDQTLGDRSDFPTRVKPFGSRFAAHMLLLLSRLFGFASLLLFALFLFLGSLNLVNLGLGEKERIALDVCLSLAFFIQHSVMIRRSYRQWLTRFIRSEFHIATYSIASGVVLLILVVFWQESAITLAAPQGIFRWLLHTTYFLSIAGFFWGVRALGFFDPLGVNPIQRYLRGKAQRSMPFVVRGPYRWVRHPLHLSLISIIWSCPNITMDRFLFNVLWTAWIIVATLLEERDHIASFGDTYRNYKREVPMLIPYRIRPFHIVGG